MDSLFCFNTTLYFRNYFLLSLSLITSRSYFFRYKYAVLNGWEFLEEYEKLGQDQKEKEIIVMLTTSLNPHDQEKAKKIAHINDFHPKPLSVKHHNRILEKVF